METKSPIPYVPVPGDHHDAQFGELDEQLSDGNKETGG